MMQVQFPSPVSSIFRLAESLENPGSKGKSHLRAQTVP